jgi:hypothetical protein
MVMSSPPDMLADTLDGDDGAAIAGGDTTTKSNKTKIFLNTKLFPF